LSDGGVDETDEAGITLILPTGRMLLSLKGMQSGDEIGNSTE
jgi:hypothetical protein